MTNTVSIDLMTHLHRLAGEIGCRLIGTQGNHAAAEYITGIFNNLGMEVTAQEIPCPDWHVEETRLELAREGLEAYANTFSPACDVTGGLLPVGSLAELEAAELTGRIPVFYGELTTTPLSTKAFFFTSDRDRRIIQILEERGPAAVITVNPSIGSRYRMIEDSDLNLSSVTVPAEVGRKLVQSTGQVAHLRISARRAPGITTNLIARLPGQRPGRIVLCAHYDTKEDTAGAWDNASGSAVLLGLAQTFAQSDPSSRPTLEFAAFTREEYFTSPEDEQYHRENLERYGEMIAAINVDGVGHSLAATNLASFSASLAFEELVKSVHARFPAVIRVDPWPASNHFLFFSNGVPSLAFSSTGLNNIIHTPWDTEAWISTEKLQEVVAIVREIVEELANKDAAWTRN